MRQHQERKFAVAPMMDWTDRHCRFFHRQFTRRALLFTEMIVADAIVRGRRNDLLAYSPAEHPIAVQFGGADPATLARAASIAADMGYDEVNLNVGCPSVRVQSGTFGACLMRTPNVVGECVAAMKAAVAIPVTVKCRLGVDDQDPESALDALADAVFRAGGDGLWVHARKAWLEGLSARENRTVPPLDYERVARLKRRLLDKFIGINGGIGTLDAAASQLERVDGAMVGRAAYETPMLLSRVDSRIHGDAAPGADAFNIAERMIAYAEAAPGVRLHRITRHMLGLFHGRPGARAWRQRLTTGATDRNADAHVIRDALRAVVDAAESAERAAA